MRILTTILCLALLTLPACHRSVERRVGDPAYLDMFEEYSPDSLRRALEQGGMTAEEEMVASGKLGIVYASMARYDSARLLLNRAIAMPGGRDYMGGRFITNLAGTYAAQGRYAEALKHYLDALRQSERYHSLAAGKQFSQWDLNVQRACAGIARMHYLTGNMDEALRYALRAREIDKRYAWNYISPQYLLIIGMVQLERGETDAAQGTMELMLDVSEDLNRALVEANEGNDFGMYMHLARGHEGLARVALARGESDVALEHGLEALRHAEPRDNAAVTAGVMHALSDVYLARGDRAESGRYARRALELFAEYGRQKPDVLFNVASAALAERNVEEADEYFRLYADRMKENNDRQFRGTMAGMDIVYETEKKEARISALEKQRVLYIIVGIAGLLLAVAIWILLRQKILNERKEKQLASANAILEWEKKERKRFASDLHDGINGMLLAIKIELGTVQPLQSIRDQIDVCIETIRRMSRGIMPGSLERYGLKAALENYCRLFPNVDFHFFGEERRIGERLELTVYYCAYELISNSFRHSGAKNIDVQLVQDSGLVSLTVQDDGCGFDEQCVCKGFGLRNIRDRVGVFNGKIDIASAPGKGTETNIELSIKNA